MLQSAIPETERRDSYETGSHETGCQQQKGVP